MHRNLPFLDLLVVTIMARTNGSVRRSWTVTVVCHFCMENRSSKILLSYLFPKKTFRWWIWKIWTWISSEESTRIVDFMNSWSVSVRFHQENAKSVFGFRNPDLDFLEKKHPNYQLCRQNSNYEIVRLKQKFRK